MWMSNTETWKLIGAVATGVVAVSSSYIALGGPIPATRAYVLIQADQLKLRLIDNSIQTNKLEISLLRKEQADRQIQVEKELNPQVKQIYQERLRDVTENITRAANSNVDLQQEKQKIGKD